MLRFAGAFAALVSFWLLLSGMFTPFLVTAGFGCALFVAFFCKRMDVIDKEGFPIDLAGKALLSYWPWLIKEILKSGWDVSKRIVSPQLPISPTLVEFKPLQQTPMGLVIHANSITLTPGTIAVEVEPGRFLVHALTSDGAAGLENSEMDQRCLRLEGN